MNKTTIRDVSNALHNARTAIPYASAPDEVPYGYIYTMNLIIGDKVHTTSFKYNSANYASEDGADEALGRLVAPLFAEDNVQNVELPGVISYLLDPSERPHTDDWSRDENGQVTVKGSRCRYRNVTEIPGTGKRKKYHSGWKHLPEDWLIVITPIAPWKDPAVDEVNKTNAENWVRIIKEDIAKAQAQLTLAAESAEVCIRYGVGSDK